MLNPVITVNNRVLASVIVTGGDSYLGIFRYAPVSGALRITPEGTEVPPLVRNMGLLFDANGCLVCDDAIYGGTIYTNQGFACKDTGAVLVTLAAPNNYLGGLPLLNGRLCYELLGSTTVTVETLDVDTLVRLSAHSQTFVAAGGTAPYTWAVTAGAVPAGMTFSTAGILSGTPTTEATYNWSVTATGTTGGTSSPQAYTSTVLPRLDIVTPSPLLPNSVVGVFYTRTMTGSGGTPPYIWAQGIAFPNGMNVVTASATLGTFQGSPLAAGLNNYTFQITDASGYVYQELFTHTTDP